MTTLDAARQYVQRGYVVIPVPFGEKNPNRKGWPDERLSASDLPRVFGNGPVNIGILNGEPSGWRVDIDFDADEAIALADRYFPPTGAVWGRQRRPNSHRGYIAPCAETWSLKDPKTNEEIVGLRSTGSHTLVGPSRHPDGDRYTVIAGEPAITDPDALYRAMWVVYTDVLHRRYPDEADDLIRKEELKHRRRLAIPDVAASSSSSQPARQSGDSALDRGHKWADEVPVPATEADGSCRLIKVIGAYKRAGLTEDETVAAVRDYASRRPFPRDYSEEEIRKRYRQSRAAPSVQRTRCKGTTVPIAEAGPPTGDDDRAEVFARDDDLTVLLGEAWEALGAHNSRRPYVFRFGGQASAIETTERGEPIIRPLSVDALREHLALTARWVRREKAAGKAAKGEKSVTWITVPTKPPHDLARIMLATPRNVLPPLLRIVRAPLVAPSGRVIASPGYDSETGVYFWPGSLIVPTIPDSPTAVQVKDAVSLLCDDLLGDFPFVGDADRANALAMMLLPFAREIIGDDPTPLHLIEKPAPGTGAGLLIEAAGHIASGKPPASMTEGRDEDEWRKRITATLMAGTEHIWIDNLRRRLDSAALSAATTARQWTDRMLGSNTQVIILPVRCVWVATGNNPAVSSEIARRVVSIRLDAATDRPWEREPTQFRHPRLLEWVKSERSRIIGAVLTLIRAWIATERPDGQTTLGSYERWAGVMGGILDTAGVPGFLDNRERFYNRADRETETWRAFIGAWWDRFGNQRVGVAELWNILEGDDNWPAVEPPTDLGKGSDRSQRKRLGDALSAAVDRRFTVDGQALRIEAAGERSRAKQYQLVLRDQ